MSSYPSEPVPGVRTRTRSRTVRRLQGCSIAVATLLLVEVLVRVVAHAVHRDRGLVFDAELGWRPLPDLVRVGKEWSADVPARTNSHGWRDVERALEKPPGVVRIAVLGDSQTWGQGVDYGQRYTDRLQAEVEQLEALNFGVIAYGPDQELRLLETEALGFHPDVIVVETFLGNDLDELRLERHSAWPKPYYDLVDGSLLLHPPEETWDVRLRQSSYLCEIAYRVFAKWLPRNVEAPSLRGRDTIPLLGAIGARMKKVAEEHGAHFLVLLAHASDAPSSPPSERDARACAALEREGVAVLDLDSAFATHRAAGEVLFQPDGHWNAAGHALVASELAADLRRRAWLPAR